MPYKDPEQGREYRKNYYLAHRDKRPAYRLANIERERASARRASAKRRDKHKAWVVANAEKVKASNKAYKDAHRAEARAAQLAYLQANRETVLTKSRAAYAANREERRGKTHAHYRKNQERLKANARARATANPEKTSARARKYRLEHLEEERARQRAYGKAHPERKQVSEARRRAQKASAPVNDFTAAQWQAMLEHYAHRCIYCGRQMHRLTQDHLTPLSQGGSHTLANIVPACRSCNSRKHTHPAPVMVQPLLLTLAPAKKKVA